MFYFLRSLNISCIILFTATILLVINFPEVLGNNDGYTEWISCNLEFTDKEAKVKVFEDCAKKHNYKLSMTDTFEKALEVMKEISSKDFDDGCFSKCWFESLNLIDKDGKISVDMSFYKTSNITEALRKEVQVILEDCAKNTESNFKDIKDKPCKLYANNEYCIMMKIDENKNRLLEACNKKN